MPTVLEWGEGQRLALPEGGFELKRRGPNSTMYMRSAGTVTALTWDGAIELDVEEAAFLARDEFWSLL